MIPYTHEIEYMVPGNKQGVEVEVVLLTIHSTNLLREFLLPVSSTLGLAGLECLTLRGRMLPQKKSV